jgi:FkbM family methyltransferase
MIPRDPKIYNFFKRYVDRYNGENNDNMITNGEMRFLQSNIGNDSVIFDIGANIGKWTKLVLNINKRLNIHCFEPSKYTFKKLINNNFPPNVICNNIGLSSAKKEEFIYIFKEGSGLNSLYQRKRLDEHNEKIPQHQKEKIQLDTLENYCSVNDINLIDYMKIDVEGHEFEVLKGGNTLFNNNRVNIIQFEYGGTFIDAHVLLRYIFDLFKELNYDFYKIYPDCIKLVKKYYPKIDNFQYQNWLIINKNYKFNP